MKVYVKTFGCVLNKRDSENIKGVLVDAGFSLSTEAEADIVIVNSCGVKQKTQSKVVSYVNSLSKDVYLGGCLPRMVDMTKMVNVKGYFDTNSILSLAEQILSGKSKSFSDVKEVRIGKRIVRSDDALIVPISQGCLGSCAFCGTRLARGKLQSYAMKDIVAEVEKYSFSKLYLTSQDNGCYGFDIGTNLIELLKEVLKVDKEFVLRVGMMNPEHVISMVDSLVSLYKDNRVMKFIHVPVQSGSDKVLKEMGRKYSVAEFKEVVTKFRSAFPSISVATDIIVGYPTETEDDFLETLELLEWLKPEVWNLSMFGSRPGTKGAKLKPLKSEIVKERSERVYSLLKVKF
jgi:threonylcarbamoyladenosine tRNA methylthiotransferase CDKAL1